MKNFVYKNIEETRRSTCIYIENFTSKIYLNYLNNILNKQTYSVYSLPETVSLSPKYSVIGYDNFYSSRMNLISQRDFIYTESINGRHAEFIINYTNILFFSTEFDKVISYLEETLIRDFNDEHFIYQKELEYLKNNYEKLICEAIIKSIIE